MTVGKYGGEDAQWNTDPTAPVKKTTYVPKPLTYGPSGVPTDASEYRPAINLTNPDGTTYTIGGLATDPYSGRNNYAVSSSGLAAPTGADPTAALRASIEARNSTNPASFGSTTNLGDVWGALNNPYDPAAADAAARAAANAQRQGSYDALGAYLADLQGRDVAGIYNAQLGNIASSFGGQIAGANQRFDALGGEVGSAGTAGRARMGDIVRLMQERGLLGQQAAQQSFGQADTRLADLQSQFGLADQGNAAGVNKILSAFDAGSVDAMQQPTQNLFQAARGNTAAVGGMYDQNFVDRSNVSENIGQDINRQLSAQEQSLMNQIAVKRQQEVQALQQQQAAQEFAIQQQLMRAQEARAAQEAEVRMEMAKLGITG